MSGSFVIPLTIACQASLFMGFPSQDYCGGLPFLSPGDFPSSGIEPTSPVLVDGFFTTEPPAKCSIVDTIMLNGPLFLKSEGVDNR